MKYKVGDKVRVKSLDELKNNYCWEDMTDSIFEEVMYKGCNFDIPSMAFLCGSEISINDIRDNMYTLLENNYVLADWMLEDVVKEKPVNLSKEWTGSHYDFFYNLTEEDIKNGKIKLDPYFVGKQWKIGSKDDSGILVHQLKTIARFGSKNDIKREVKALYEQAKRMMEIYEVKV